MEIIEKTIVQTTLNRGNYEQSNRVYSVNGLAPTCNTCGGGNRETKIIENMKTYTEQEQSDEIQDGANVTEYRIRKLTPKECFRLMGVDDADADKMAQVVSKSQQYKLAGNSIVVDVLAAIFDKLYIHKENEEKQLTLF